jgi:hypothetical protein
MEYISSSIRTVIARVITDKPVRKTPYQVKGVFMRQYPDLEIVPMMDGTYRDRFLYPRVQIKILNEQVYMIGIHEGVDPIVELADRLDILDFGNITFQVFDTDVNIKDDQFRAVDRLVRYRLLTPWVALNQTTGSRYRFLNNMERIAFLNRLLGQNIVFLAREMGIKLQNKVFTKVNLTSMFPKPVDERNWGAFSGEFRTNFLLPNYLGIGNGITRGYGAVYGMFNPQSFQFDEASLKEASQNGIQPESDALAMSDLEGVTVDEVPKPKRHKAKKRKPKKSTKKVLSEEFDIEEEEIPKSQNPKKSKNSNPQNPQNLKMTNSIVQSSTKSSTNSK